MMVAIIDYGLGNLRSVAGAVERLGFSATVTGAAAEIAAADKLILPGVGAFGDGMANLRSRGLDQVLGNEVQSRRKPILGICLGCQLVAREGEEFGRHDGLGWIDATVRRLAPSDASLRVPHVGWDELVQTAASPLFVDVPPDALFYYTHSFKVEPAQADVVVGTCNYGGAFASVLQSGNIYATQFHPEKSQQHGLTLLKNFLRNA